MESAALTWSSAAPRSPRLPIDCNVEYSPKIVFELGADPPSARAGLASSPRLHRGVRATGGLDGAGACAAGTDGFGNRLHPLPGRTGNGSGTLSLGMAAAGELAAIGRGGASFSDDSADCVCARLVAILGRRDAFESGAADCDPAADRCVQQVAAAEFSIF